MDFYYLNKLHDAYDSRKDDMHPFLKYKYVILVYVQYQLSTCTYKLENETI